MNFIVCGLQGTGKTTLSKRIVNDLGYKYINDYTICPDGFNKQKIIDFARNNDSFVIDLSYSLDPADCAMLKMLLFII